MTTLYAELWQWVQAHGMVGVFLFMFVENMGVPFPTELGFIAAQGLIEAGYVSYWLAFVVITAGHLAGAGLTYYAGRAGDTALGRWFAHRQRLTRARDRLQRYYARWGALTVLIGRLVGQVRPWSSLVAGMAQVPPGVFWLWTVIGSLVYTAAAMWVTVWGFDVWARFPLARGPLLIVLFVVFYGSVIYAVLHRWFARLVRRRRRAAAENKSS